MISSSKPRPSHSGFTLIEVIISMTIMAMIALMLYWSFAMGARVWETQDLKTSIVQRQEALIRMLGEDMARIVPYTMHGERGASDFFAGGKKNLFYVTRNGHGTLYRRGMALFFTCFFIRDDGQGAQELVVYKVAVPEPELMAELHAFQTTTATERERFLPGEEIMEQAVVVLNGLEEAEFAFSEQPRNAFVPIGQPTPVSDEEPAVLNEWLRPDFPGSIHLHYILDGAATDLVFLPESGVL